MAKRIEQINELLRSELAALITKEVYFPGCLITLTEVDCSTNLSQAKVYFTVLPENKEAAAIKILKRHNSLFTRFLNKKIKLFRIPRFIWLADEREKNARRIEKTLAEIKKNE
jgi:ribosome-binding factor A